MVDDIKPHIIGITESWANNDITNAELGLEGYVMFRKDRIGRRGGGVLPSASGLHKLLNICASYAIKHDIIYNVKKTQCMVVPSTKFKLENTPSVF